MCFDDTGVVQVQYNQFLYSLTVVIHFNPFSFLSNDRRNDLEARLIEAAITRVFPFHSK